MPLLILLAILIVPLIEIAVYIEVGSVIGIWPTIALTVLSAVVGSMLLRVQGLNTLARVRRQVEQNIPPTRELFDGLCLLVAGGMLLTPGFVTDVLGLLLFVPPVRDFLFGWFSRRVVVVGPDGRPRRPGAEPGPGPQGAPRRPGQPPVIDADYIEVEPETEPRPDTGGSDSDDPDDMPRPGGGWGKKS